MAPLDRANTGQRVVIVVGLGVALWLLGGWLTSIGTSFGWVAYAPLSSVASYPGRGLPFGLRVLIMIGFVAVWVVASVLLLARPRSDRERP